MLNHLEYEPVKWQDFYRYKEDFNIQRAKIWLEKDCLPTFLYLEGPSGSGKTVFAKTLIRSFNCEHRAPDTYDACGQCDICKADPSDLGINNNVIWVNSSFNSGSTQQSAIKEALLSAEQGPTIKPTTENPEVLFLVFEEAQNISKDLLQRVLAFGDVKNSITSRLCFIFITMSPEDMNSTVNKALRQRGSTCRFKRPTADQLKEFIQYKFKDVSDGAAKIIADEADGSFRGALNLYIDVKQIDPTLDEDVLSKIFNCVKFEDRLLLWKALQENEIFSRLKDRLINLFYFSSPTKLIKQLQNDLDEQMSKGKCSEEDYLDATRLFTEYLLYPNILNPINILTQLKKRNFGF